MQGLAGIEGDVRLNRAAFRAERDPAFFKKHDKEVCDVGVVIEQCDVGTGGNGLVEVPLRSDVFIAGAVVD